MVRFFRLLLALPLLCASPMLAAPAAKPTAIKPVAQSSGATAAPAKGAAPEFSAQRFRAHVDFLADDLLEGRGTGSRGHAIAAVAGMHLDTRFVEELHDCRP